MLLDNSTGHVDIIFTPNRVVLKGSDGAVAQLGERSSQRGLRPVRAEGSCRLDGSLF